MTFDEKRVIRRVLDGDADAFEELVRANEKNVYNLALKMTGNEQDALDLSQDAFLKAYTSLPSFNGESRFSVWLYRLTYNLCIDFLRKRKRRQTVPLDGEDENGEPYALQIPDPAPGPAETAERNQTRREILDAVQALPPNHRQILVMRCVEELSYARIAAELGVGEGTVKSRLNRARAALEKSLRQKGTYPFADRLKNGKGGEVL